MLNSQATQWRTSFPSASSSSVSCDFLTNMFYRRNRSSLLIFSSLYIIIVLTQQAVVALSIPPLSPSLSLSSSSMVPSSPPSASLVMISPQVNNIAMASMFVPESVVTNVLTPGQVVINAVPVKDRGDFIKYQLAVGLKSTDKALTKPRWQINLQDLIEYYEKELPDLTNVPIYENFATDLLQWLMEKFHYTEDDVYYHLRSRSNLYCTQDGVCYSSSDMGKLCCPF